MDKSEQQAITKDEFIKECLEMINPPKTFNIINEGKFKNWKYWENDYGDIAECGFETTRITRQAAPTIEQARYYLFMQIFRDGLICNQKSEMLVEKSLI